MGKIIKGDSMESVCLGKVVKLHGYLGQMKIATQFDEDFDVSSIKKIFSEEGDEFAVTRIFKVTDGVVVSLEGVDLEQAKKFINHNFFIDRKLVKNRILFEDLMGSTICLDNQSKIGKIVDVQDFGGAEVVTFLQNDGRENSFPAVEGLIKSFDYKTKILVLNKHKFNEVCDYED